MGKATSSADVRLLRDFFRAQVGDNLSLFPHIVRMLAEGKPVGVDRLAAEAARPVDEVRSYLSDHPSTEWNDEGQIVGHGLTLKATPHSVTFEGKTLYGWCATDVLIAPALLGTPGLVESTCPATGRRISARVKPDAVVSVDPEDAVVSEVRPSEKVADIRADVCGLGHLFSSRDAAAGWLEQNPQGRLYSVADDFLIHRDAFEELGALPSGERPL